MSIIHLIKQFIVKILLEKIEFRSISFIIFRLIIIKKF